MEVRLVFAILVAYSNGAQLPTTYDTIVIGLGSAGTYAASTLAAAGKRVLALEAQGRVGGRVNTVPFGDGIVEVGAEWIHGTHPSLVYDVAVKNNITVLVQEYTVAVYLSDGSTKYDAIAQELLYFYLSIVDDTPAVPEPLGKYLTRRIQEYVKANHTEVANDTDFMNGFLHLMDLVIDGQTASNSWNDVSTFTKYKDIKGSQETSWHVHGYKTFFEILLNTYKNGPGYPNLEIKLNTEVTKIEWPHEPKDSVVVTVKDGTKYTANNAIVTVSLGVLKERYITLFSPALPEAKTKAVEAMSIGVVDKIILRFNHTWWPVTASEFLWSSADREALSDDDKWVLWMEGASQTMACGTCLTIWMNGEAAKKMETLPIDVVRTKSMEMIRRFMGAGKTIPEPVEMIRSSWYSNPFTRGSYSYDNVLTPQHPTARSDLASPLLDSAGMPRLLFAGEATNTIHFATVHGAAETGLREAERLLNRLAN